MPSKPDLKKVLTRLKLRRAAGSTPFELGTEYFAEGRVLSFAENTGRIVATVRGAADYSVTLFGEGDTLCCQCTCPMGQEGGFCKHGVALGLAWLSGSAPPQRDERHMSPATPPFTMDEARSWLAQKEKNALIQIILDRAGVDARFREELLRQAMRERGKSAP